MEAKAFEALRPDLDRLHEAYGRLKATADLFLEAVAKCGEEKVNLSNSFHDQMNLTAETVIAESLIRVIHSLRHKPVDQAAFSECLGSTIYDTFCSDTHRKGFLDLIGKCRAQLDRLEAQTKWFDAFKEVLTNGDAAPPSTTVCQHFEQLTAPDKPPRSDLESGDSPEGDSPEGDFPEPYAYDNHAERLCLTEKEEQTPPSHGRGSSIFYLTDTIWPSWEPKSPSLTYPELITTITETLDRMEDKTAERKAPRVSKPIIVHRTVTKRRKNWDDVARFRDVTPSPRKVEVTGASGPSGPSEPSGPSGPSELAAELAADAVLDAGIDKYILTVKWSRNNDEVEAVNRKAARRLWRASPELLWTRYPGAVVYQLEGFLHAAGGDEPWQALWQGCEEDETRLLLTDQGAYSLRVAAQNAYGQTISAQTYFRIPFEDLEVPAAPIQEGVDQKALKRLETEVQRELAVFTRALSQVDEAAAFEAVVASLQGQPSAEEQLRYTRDLRPRGVSIFHWPFFPNLQHLLNRSVASEADILARAATISRLQTHKLFSHLTDDVRAGAAALADTVEAFKEKRSNDKAWRHLLDAAITAQGAHYASITSDDLIYAAFEEAKRNTPCDRTHRDADLQALLSRISSLIASWEDLQSRCEQQTTAAEMKERVDEANALSAEATEAVEKLREALSGKPFEAIEVLLEHGRVAGAMIDVSVRASSVSLIVSKAFKPSTKNKVCVLADNLKVKSGLLTSATQIRMGHIAALCHLRWLSLLTDLPSIAETWADALSKAQVRQLEAFKETLQTSLSRLCAKLSVKSWRDLPRLDPESRTSETLTCPSSFVASPITSADDAGPVAATQAFPSVLPPDELSAAPSVLTMTSSPLMPSPLMPPSSMQPSLMPPSSMQPGLVPPSSLQSGLMPTASLRSIPGGTSSAFLHSPFVGSGRLYFAPSLSSSSSMRPMDLEGPPGFERRATVLSPPPFPPPLPSKEPCFPAPRGDDEDADALLTLCDKYLEDHEEIRMPPSFTHPALRTHHLDSI